MWSGAACNIINNTLKKTLVFSYFVVLWPIISFPVFGNSWSGETMQGWLFIFWMT